MIVGAGGRKAGQDSSIFSISIDSDEQRLVTGGLDCQVRVWHIDRDHRQPMESDKDNPSPSKHLAALMSRHTGAVLCVRWSPRGHSWLATGSDDAVVLIWQKMASRIGNSAFGMASGGGGAGLLGGAVDGRVEGLFPPGDGEGKRPDGETSPPIAEEPDESYTVKHRLTGHGSDVNGLEWSADASMLASCGIDGVLLIWNASDNFVLLKRLETDPLRPLKGITWDPLGQYLAGQSDDGNLHIWRISDWKLVGKVTCPFSEAFESCTYFSRPSWSPDGKYICVPDVVNESEPVAMLVERDNWKTERSFVGHGGAIQVAKFSPSLFIEEAVEGDKKDASNIMAATQKVNSDQIILLLALGSQDGTVSIWNSRGEKPLAVITGLFEHAVMDIVWSQCGRILWIANYDGTVAKVVLSGKLVGGRNITNAEKSELFNNLQKQQLGSLNLMTSIDQVKLERRLMLASDGGGGMASVGAGECLDGEQQQPIAMVPASQSTVMSGEQITIQPFLGNEQHDSGGDNTRQTVQQHATAIPVQVEKKMKNGKRRITPQLLSDPSSSIGNIATVNNMDIASRASASAMPVIGRPAKKSWLKSPPIRTQMSIDKRFELQYIGGIKDPFTKISRIEGDRIVWEERVDGGVTNAAANKEGILVISTYNGSVTKLMVLSPAGRRMFPSILMSFPISQLCISEGGERLVCVCDTGVFYVWKLPDMICEVVEELPTHGLYAELFGITIGEETDLPDELVVTFNFGGSRLFYSKKRRSFFEVEMPIDLRLLMGWDFYPSSNNGQPSAEQKAAEMISKLLGMDDKELRTKSMAYMEMQLASSQLMGERDQLAVWLKVYSQRIALDENYAKATELIEMLREASQALKKVVAISFLASSSHLIRELSTQLI